MVDLQLCLKVHTFTGRPSGLSSECWCNYTRMTFVTVRGCNEDSKSHASLPLIQGLAPYHTTPDAHFFAGRTKNKLIMKCKTKRVYFLISFFYVYILFLAFLRRSGRMSAFKSLGILVCVDSKTRNERRGKHTRARLSLGRCYSPISSILLFPRI